jgi:hypothetical protein
LACGYRRPDAETRNGYRYHGRRVTAADELPYNSVSSLRWMSTCRQGAHWWRSSANRQMVKVGSATADGPKDRRWWELIAGGKQVMLTEAARDPAFRWRPVVGACRSAGLGRW